MFSFDLGGLPAHPLLIHVPVVLLPLAALGSIAMAIHRPWLRTYGVLVTVLAGVGFLGAMLAANTGEELVETFRDAGQTISPSLSDHAEMGDSVQIFAGIFFVLLLAWVLFSRWRDKVGEERTTAVVRKPKVVAIVLAVLVVISGAVATVSVTWTGHSGAKTVWEKNKL